MYCTVIKEIMENKDFFWNTCFKEHNKMAIEKYIKTTIYKKAAFRSSHIIGKTHGNKFYQ